MHPSVIACHYDEVALKGKNRSVYENRLKQAIQRALMPVLGESMCIHRCVGRILVSVDHSIDNETQQRVTQALSYVYGLSHFSFAVSTAPDMEQISRAAASLVAQHSGGSFRVTATRSDKSFGFTSPEIQKTIGEHIVRATHKTVDLHHPDVTCYIDILKDRAVVYTKKIPGPRGLPVGTSGHILVSLSGGIDSPVAAGMLQKRGARVSCIHFHVYPYTSRASIEKVRELSAILARYQETLSLLLVPFADTQQSIASACPEKLRVILYRRMMIRIAQEAARQRNIRALATGEALGQVASQTLENLAATDNAAQMLILRPLIGFDKIEIMRRAQRIGTYDISIRPHDDACTRFMPKHPETRAAMRDVHRAEEELDIPALLSDAMRNITEETITA